MKIYLAGFKAPEVKKPYWIPRRLLNFHELRHNIFNARSFFDVIIKEQK